MSVTGRQPDIQTGLGRFSREKFCALLDLRAASLAAARRALAERGYTEVTVSSLVNIAGSCENPYASFTLPYYGREAHLSQSAQLQLESLVIRLGRAVFTVSNSFREEHYDDPEAEGRRLSEFTLIEPERPYPNLEGNEILSRIQNEQELVVKQVVKEIVKSHARQISLLGGDNEYLSEVVNSEFPCLTYDEAISYLNREHDAGLEFGDDLGIKEERCILRRFGDCPTFVTHHPASIKFFNMHRTTDQNHVYSIDLLMPRLGETVGGAVREPSGEKIRQQLMGSKIAEYAHERGLDPTAPFAEYFSLFRDEPEVPRGGFGIGFERFIGFLTRSNDILETIAYRTMQP